VAGKVASKQGTFKESRTEDGEDRVSGKASVKVHTLYVLAPEDLT